MRRFVRLCAVVSLGGLGLGAALGPQTAAQAVPKNQQNATPGGANQPGCTASVSRSNGKIGGSSTCTTASGSTVTVPAPAAQRFPYPGEAAPDPSLQSAQTPSTAGNIAPAASPQGASQRFPYPGEAPASDAAKAPRGAPGLQDAGSSGDSSGGEQPGSSSSSSSSSAGAPTPDSAEDDTPLPVSRRKKLPPVPRQTPQERADEDIQIAKYYQDDGNYLGAYLRAKDAVALLDTDPEAQFLLAFTARKLGKLDEAQQHFKRCLELDPIPKQKKEAQKALKEMGGTQ